MGVFESIIKPIMKLFVIGFIVQLTLGTLAFVKPSVTFNYSMVFNITSLLVIINLIAIISDIAIIFLKVKVSKKTISGRLKLNGKENY